MIVFSPIAPEYFATQLGLGVFKYTRQMFVFNLLSYDIRYPKVERLIPDVSRLSEYALMNDDSDIFEQEYFHYLLTNEGAFLDIMNIMSREYRDGSTLIIIETNMDSKFCDSVVSSLIKYIYTRYGIKASVVQRVEDLDDLRIENSIFSPQGLMTMDSDITIINNICPEMFADWTDPTMPPEY